MKKVFFSFLSLFFFAIAFAQPTYEFRGVWVASVSNIDWPMPNQYRPDLQRAEFINQLDMHQRNGMNAIIGQVRPAADALYPSPYEPWSQWLTRSEERRVGK